MDCPSCAGKVDNQLDRLEGVMASDLRPTARRATVTYDPAQVEESAVVSAIEAAGYDVEHRDGSELAPPSTVWTTSRAIRTWIGAVFLLGGLSFEFVLTGLNDTLGTVPTAVSTADLAFLFAVVASGLPVVRSGYYSLRSRSLDIDLLMGTAIVAATGLGLYVEAATLAVLFSIAELLEDYAIDRTRDSLRELVELAPEQATVLRDGEERTVPVEEIVVGDTVLVRPGEKVPVDGVVRDGKSAVDQSPITGESVPVDKTTDDDVYAGTLNEDGYLEVAATTDATETTLSRIIDLVREAETKTTDKEQFVDRFSAYYTPAVVVLAMLTATLPPLVIDGGATLAVAGYTHAFAGGWETWFVRGLTLLVIACPCAFVISTPVSVTSGVTAAARNGVLIKGGTHLETMGEVDAIAFDKTGTLTKGELTVTDVVPVAGTSQDEVLGYAGALEQRSDHPIATAIRDRAEATGKHRPDVSAFESITGKGVRARIDGTTYYAGKPGLFEERGTALDGTEPRSDGGVSVATTTADDRPASAVVSSLQAAGKTVVVVGTDAHILGVIGIADEIRPEAKQAIQKLHTSGVEPLVMLTGDNEGTARAVADELGLDEYRAELLPEEKVDAVEKLERDYGTVAVVGDGINDAPALATATVGVAMGAAGTDTAIETADIALMGDNIGTLPYLSALSRRANGVIRQNIWSSLGVKLLLAVGVPFGYVSVALAVVIGDMGMSLGVTANAMRLARMQPDRFLDE
jgi:Cd2+/Zn2+-exporting ATPase